MGHNGLYLLSTTCMYNIPTEELTQQLFLAIHTLYCRLEEMPNQFRSIGTYMARSILVEQLTQLAMVPDHLHIFVIFH